MFPKASQEEVCGIGVGLKISPLRVLVTSVHPKGPSFGKLSVGDEVVDVDGEGFVEMR